MRTAQEVAKEIDILLGTTVIKNTGIKTGFFSGVSIQDISDLIESFAAEKTEELKRYRMFSIGEDKTVHMLECEGCKELQAKLTEEGYQWALRVTEVERQLSFAQAKLKEVEDYLAGCDKFRSEMTLDIQRYRAVVEAAIKWYHETDGFDSQALSDVIGKHIAALEGK